MNFRTLFALRPVHPYFSAGSGPGYRFVPTERTEKQMRRNSQRLHSTVHYCEVLQDFDKLGQEENKGNCFFDIALYPEDDRFLIYSELDIDYQAGCIYLLRNRFEPPGAPENFDSGPTLIDRLNSTKFGAEPLFLKGKTFSLPPPGWQGRYANSKGQQKPGAAGMESR